MFMIFLDTDFKATTWWL